MANTQLYLEELRKKNMVDSRSLYAYAVKRNLMGGAIGGAVSALSTGVLFVKDDALYYSPVKGLDVMEPELALKKENIKKVKYRADYLALGLGGLFKIVTNTGYKEVYQIIGSVDRKNCKQMVEQFKTTK